jgi:hypothetical protein
MKSSLLRPGERAFVVVSLDEREQVVEDTSDATLGDFDRGSRPVSKENPRPAA